MNYYERHLGDYAKDTGHLSMLEHGAYTLLLDRYYSTEEGIPADQVHRIARARSKEEKDAVDIVLQEFFVLENGVWINHRAEEEIEKARVKIEAAKANGKKGGRPKKETQAKANDNPTTNLNETHTKPTGFLLGSEIETQLKAHQTPDTRHHINTNSAATELAVLESADFPAAMPDESKKPPGRNIEISVLLRNLGVKPMTGQHPLCIELAQNPKATDDVLKAAVEHARQQKGDGTDIHPNYLAKILPDYLDPKPKKEPSEAWWRSEDGIVRKGRELGMEARYGEGYPEFTTRLHEEIRERKRKGIAA